MIARCVLLAVVLLPCSGAMSHDDADLFQAPVQLMAGGAELAKGTLYPSPELQDLDGDDQPELLIGDLVGRITFARRAGSGPEVTWSTLEPLKTADGKDIKFDNW
jgi:hypothetical protein